MSKWKFVMVLLIVAGIALIAVAVVYWTKPAGSLPAFFPGHLAGSAHKHVKHGIAAFIVGILCFIGAWMVSARE